MQIFHHFNCSWWNWQLTKMGPKNSFQLLIERNGTRSWSQLHGAAMEMRTAYPAMTKEENCRHKDALFVYVIMVSWQRSSYANHNGTFFQILALTTNPTLEHSDSVSRSKCCEHKFHTSCYKQWLMGCDGKNLSCPYCRCGILRRPIILKNQTPSANAESRSPFTWLFDIFYFTWIFVLLGLLGGYSKKWLFWYDLGFWRMNQCADLIRYTYYWGWDCQRRWIKKTLLGWTCTCLYEKEVVCESYVVGAEKRRRTISQLSAIAARLLFWYTQTLKVVQWLIRVQVHYGTYFQQGIHLFII